MFGVNSAASHGKKRPTERDSLSPDDQHRDKRTSTMQTSVGRCEEEDKLDDLKKRYCFSVPKIIEYHWNHDRQLTTLRDIEEIVPELERSSTREPCTQRIWRDITTASIALKKWMGGHASWKDAVKADDEKTMPRIPRSARMRATMYLTPDEEGIPGKVRHNLAQVELEWLVDDGAPTDFWKGALLDDLDWREKYMDGHDMADKPWIRRNEIATIPNLLSVVFSVREQRSKPRYAARNRQLKATVTRRLRDAEIMDLRSDVDDETGGRQHIAPANTKPMSDNRAITKPHLARAMQHDSLSGLLLSSEKRQKLDSYRSRTPADWESIPRDQRRWQNMEYKALLREEDIARSAPAMTLSAQLEIANDRVASRRPEARSNPQTQNDVSSTEQSLANTSQASFSNQEFFRKTSAQIADIISNLEMLKTIVTVNVNQADTLQNTTTTLREEVATLHNKLKETENELGDIQCFLIEIKHRVDNMESKAADNAPLGDKTQAVTSNLLAEIQKLRRKVTQLEKWKVQQDKRNAQQDKRMERLEAINGLSDWISHDSMSQDDDSYIDNYETHEVDE